MADQLESAIALVQSGNSDEALVIFNRLLADSNNKPAVLGHRAWLYFQARKFDLALQDYVELAKIQGSENLEIQFLIAECLIEQKRFDEASSVVSLLTQKAIQDRRLLYLMLRVQNASIDRDTYLNNIHGIFPNPMAEILASTNVYFPAPINQHIGLFLYSLVRNIRPDYVIEIGSFIGVSAIYLAQALRDNQLGHLFCFDLFDHTLTDITGTKKNQLDTFNEHIQCAGLSDIVTPYSGDSSNLISSINLGIPEEAPSIIFIDGDHTLKGVLKDFNAVRQYFNRNTLVLLHDVNYKHCNWMGPAILAKRLHGDNNYNLTIIPTVDHTDFAIIQSNSSHAMQAVKPSILDLILHKFYYLVRSKQE